MTPEAFQSRLSAHEWHYHMLPPSEYNHHGWNEVRFIAEAREHGLQHIFNAFYHKEFGIPFFKDFPVAALANEQPKNTDMNINVNITTDPQILAVLNRIADNLGIRHIPGMEQPVTAPQSDTATAPQSDTATAPQETAEAPVKRPRKAKAEPEPEKTESKADPESEKTEFKADSESVPTGQELTDQLKEKGLFRTDYSKKLRGYMDVDLGLKDVKLPDVTDTEKLKLIAAKMAELVAEKAEAESSDI